MRFDRPRIDGRSTSSLERCANRLLSLNSTTIADKSVEYSEADSPVRFALAIELIERKRFAEAYGYLITVAKTSGSPDCLCQRDYFQAIIELVKCCNILGKEDEGVAFASRTLKGFREAASRVQVCSMQITLADSLIGQKKYERAEKLLRDVLSNHCPSAYLREVASLRLNKVERRLGVLTTVAFSSGEALGNAVISRQDKVNDVRNECLDELLACHCFIKQRQDEGETASDTMIGKTMAVVAESILSKDWRVLALHDRVSSGPLSVNPIENAGNQKVTYNGGVSSMHITSTPPQALVLINPFSEMHDDLFMALWDLLVLQFQPGD